MRVVKTYRTIEDDGTVRESSPASANPVAVAEAKALWAKWNAMTLEGRRMFARQFHSNFHSIGDIEKWHDKAD